jgi:hypothetical protein
VGGVMSVLKRFSISLDDRYFRQQQPGVMTNSVGFNDFLTPSPNVWNPSPIHTSQLVVDASFLMDKRLVDEAAWTQNRAITLQEVPDHGEPIPANDSCTFCSIRAHGPSPP